MGLLGWVLTHALALVIGMFIYRKNSEKVEALIARFGITKKFQDVKDKVEDGLEDIKEKL